jgi:hypothetical protein
MTSSSLLLTALLRKDGEAQAAWKRWRATVHTQALSWPEIQFLSLLQGPRLNLWLANDEDAPIFRGIIRRTWADTQLRLAMARTAMQLIEARTGAAVTLAGSVGRHLGAEERSAIRPITELDLLLPRQAVLQAAGALEAEGWVRYGQMPSQENFNWSTHVSFAQSGVVLRLRWRMLDVPQPGVRGCEDAFLGGNRQVTAQGVTYRVLSPEYALLEIFSDEERVGDADQIPWEADAAMAIGDRLRWDEWVLLAHRFCPQAIGRVQGLRSYGIDVPELRAPPSVELAQLEILQPKSSLAGRLVGRLRHTAGRMRLAARRIVAALEGR